MDFVSRLANALYEFLFPKSDSVLELERLTPREMLEHLPPAERLASPDTLAVFAYEHPVVREMIWELKYRSNRLVAEKLASILYDLLKEELAERALTENFIDAVLVPMPISDKRRNERGYNQTEILCSEVKRLDTEKLFKYLPRQLVKHRHTERQTLAATREERLENVRGTMHVIHAPAVRGKCVVLIDDVTTTGASFAEACRALKEAGARKVLCIAVAH